MSISSDRRPPFFVEKRTKRATLYYWQPSAALRKQGYLQRRLNDNRDAAVRQCREINAEFERDKARLGSSIKRGTVSWLIREFKDDHRYRSKRHKTRQGYDQNMAIIERVFGDVPVPQITRPVLEKFYNKMHKRTPWQANAVMTMFRRLLFFAVALGIAPTNPGSRMELTGNLPRQQKWEDTALDTFLPVAQNWRPSIWLATILGAELGQRKADILKIRREDLRVRGVHVVQNKGGVVVEVPCSARLRAALKKVPLEPGYLVVSETTGEPYTGYTFTHLFAKIRAAAGIEGLRFQDLRRTCVVNLGRAGCTPAEIAAVTGHRIDTVVDILETYLPRDNVMAKNAIDKLDRWRSDRSRRRRKEQAIQVATKATSVPEGTAGAGARSKRRRNRNAV